MLVVKYAILSVLWLFSEKIVHSAFPVGLIREFYTSKGIRTIFLRPCIREDGLEIIKFLNVRYHFSTKILRTADELNEKFSTPGRVGIYVDLKCEKNIIFFEEVAPAQSHILVWSWLLHVDDINSKLFTARAFGFMNDATIARSEMSNVFLYNAFVRPWLADDLVLTQVGSWSQKSLAYQLPRREYSLDRSVLNGAIFMTQNIYHDDKLYDELQNKTYMPSLDTANRFYYAVSLHIADLYNYTLHLMKSDDWGNRLPNGTWTGMLGMLNGGAADLTVGPARLATERMDTATPLFPIQRFMFPFVFKQPRKTGTYKALALQLQTDAWLFTGIMAIISCLSLSVLQWFRNRTKLIPKYAEEEGSSLAYNAILVIGSICQQGLVHDPPDLARRIACIWILFCCLMISTYYNAATMNALLSPSPPSIRNLQQLVTSDIPLALNDVPYFTHPKVRALIIEESVMKRVDHFSLGFLSLDQGLQLILKGGALCGEDFTLFKGIDAAFKDEQKCDLSVIPTTRPIPASFWIPKNSPYKEILFQGAIFPLKNVIFSASYGETTN